jgi:hypothetical protein
MISIMRVAAQAFAMLSFVNARSSTTYDEDAKIQDVRGGVELLVTYPPNLVDTIGNRGKIETKLGNFGHI